MLLRRRPEHLSEATLGDLTSKLESLSGEISSSADEIEAARKVVRSVASILDEVELRLELRTSQAGEDVAGLRFAMNTLDGRLTHDVIGLDERLERLAKTVTTTLETVFRSGAERAPAHASEEALPSIRVDELLSRVARLERDRDETVAAAARAASSWASERAALQERVGELAAQVVPRTTRPGAVTSNRPREGDVGWVMLERDVDMVRIGMEGLRMRLAHVEKSTAGSRRAGGDGEEPYLDRIADRLDRLESAVAEVEGAAVLERLEYIANRMNSQLARLED